MTNTTHVRIQNISKVFADGGTRALRDINLEIKEGEILVLLGSSGCGKSTLLRIIGGLEKATQGRIYFYDREISALPPEQRNIGFVFQNYALFPTMTVRENISFGLKLKKLKKDEIHGQVDKLLDMMNLNDFADRKPIQLSGGQQQRVAIARVLAIEPKILLLDEPLTALDAKLKEYLRIELALLFRRLGITTIYVTHDQLEAMSIADCIAIMNEGVIEQLGTPREIYTAPKTDFVAQFIGNINRLTGTVVKENGTFLDIGAAKIPVQNAAIGEESSIFVRPEDISVAENNDVSPGVIESKVLQCVFMGDHCHINAEIAGQKLTFSVKNDQKFEAGETIRIKLDINKLILL
jgi:putative spermidine/putrescine transport system ATP-binding protein